MSYLERLNQAGIRVHLDGDQLVISGDKNALTDDDWTLMRERKQDIIDELPGFIANEGRQALIEGKAWIAPDLDEDDEAVLQWLH